MAVRKWARLPTYLTFVVDLFAISGKRPLKYNTLVLRRAFISPSSVLILSVMYFSKYRQAAQPTPLAQCNTEVRTKGLDSSWRSQYSEEERPRDGRPRNRLPICGVDKRLSVLHSEQTSIVAPLVSCRMGTLGWSRRSVKMTTHIHLVPRLRMSGVIHLFLHMPLWRLQWQLYLYRCGNLPSPYRPSL